MAAVDTIDRRTTIPLESEQRADAIHDTQDTNSPAGGTDGADVVKYPGDDLFSQGVAPRVSSALESLTSVFGMGTGGSSPLASPG